MFSLLVRTNENGLNWIGYYKIGLDWTCLSLVFDAPWMDRTSFDEVFNISPCNLFILYLSRY